MMMRKYAIITFLLVISSCSANATRQASSEPQSTDTSALIAELPLPQIPDSLTTPKDRATYLITHFWDALDAGDTLTTRNREFLEQNFVNFVNIYPHADSTLWTPATERFLSKTTPDPETRRLVYELIDTYLGSNDSPVSSDDVYINFLSAWVKLPGMDSYELLEPGYRLAAALKNRPGTEATDFKFITREGKQTSLHAQPGTLTLLLLYDPDCDHCMETIETLRQDNLINNLVKDGKLNTLAVCVESDRQLWDKTKSAMPTNWTVGFDQSAILDNELYDIPEMPGIYLLDKDRKVLLRDPTTTKLMEKLKSL